MAHPILANVIIPIVPMFFKASLLLLVFVIVLETVIIIGSLKTTPRETLKICAIANLLSTSLGLVLWPFDNLLSIFGLGAPIGILAFAISVYVEHWIFSKRLKTVKRGKILKAVVIANIASYIAIIVLAVFFAERAANRPRRPSIACAGNLKQIGLAIQQYAIENEDCFPNLDGAEGMRLLVRSDHLTAGHIYTSPRSAYRHQHKPADDPGTMDEKNLSYVYFGGFGESHPGGTPVAFSKPMPDMDFINVLFKDGGVQGFSGDFPDCVSVIKFLDRQGRIPEGMLEQLLEKAAAYERDILGGGD